MLRELVSKDQIEVQYLDVFVKAGRLVGLADCFAVIVLADNATFLLAENRIPAF